jgi:hypothetical protein
MLWNWHLQIDYNGESRKLNGVVAIVPHTVRFVCADKISRQSRLYSNQDSGLRRPLDLLTHIIEICLRRSCLRRQIWVKIWVCIESPLHSSSDNSSAGPSSTERRKHLHILSKAYAMFLSPIFPSAAKSWCCPGAWSNPFPHFETFHALRCPLISVTLASPSVLYDIYTILS